MTQAAALMAPRMVEFNQLPSRTLHASRHAQYAPQHPPYDVGRVPQWSLIWHRHWSRDILARLGLRDRPVTDPLRPELALALLPPEGLAQCARRIGVALCGQRLRCIIAGPEVRTLLSDLGPGLLDFARQQADALHSGLLDSAHLSLEEMVSTIDDLGRGVLLAALQGAGPELALRAELKLPAGTAQQSPLEGAQALRLALAVLKVTDPSWHSSFPAIH